MTSRKQKQLSYHVDNQGTPWGKRIDEVEALLMEHHYGINHGFRTRQLPRHRLNDLKFGNKTISYCIELIDDGGQEALHRYLISLI